MLWGYAVLLFRVLVSPENNMEKFQGWTSKVATDMRNVSANKANAKKPLELFVQGEGVVVEWPRNIKKCHKSA